MGLPRPFGLNQTAKVAYAKFSPKVGFKASSFMKKKTRKNHLLNSLTSGISEPFDFLPLPLPLKSNCLMKVSKLLIFFYQNVVKKKGYLLLKTINNPLVLCTPAF